MDIAQKTQKENEQRVAEEYLSSLSDLNCNSKPLINMLTMLAEENIEYAPVIVKVVEEHIAKVPSEFKLPILYLIDSIVKNVKSMYVQLFSQCIVNIFCGVFEKVNEKIRERMYALRQTWNEVFSVPKLYALDVKVKRMDVNWPITAKQPQPSIHVNPNFLKTVNAAQTIPTDMEEILHAKTRELLELKKRKLELELEATKKHLEEQEKQLSKATESVIPPAVDAHVGTLPGIRPQAIPSQIIPGVMAPNMMPAHPSIGMGAIRPGMYQHYRNPRPQQQQQQQPTVTPTSMINVPQNFPMNNAGKAKVHPVTPSLLNSMRQRDPRLARQQQQQQQQQQQMQHSSSRKIQKSGINPQQCVEDSRPDSSSTGKESSSSNGKTHTSSRSGGNNSSGAGFDRKSPTRHSSSSSRGRSSSKNSNRDKDRGRKRNDSRSSNTSSAGSSDRRKMGSSSSSNEKSKCDDKDAFEIASLSSTFKRNSSSPCSSPTKSKEAKRSPKSRNTLRSKNRSRSPSPEITSSDIDLRVKNSPDKRIKLSSASPLSEKDVEKERKAAVAVPKDLEKNVEEVLVPMPMLSSKDVDLRQYTSPSALTTINQAVVSSITTANVATSSPKVSFKIQKPFNKLEKSTENLSTVTSRDAVVLPIDSKILKRDFIDKVNNNSSKPLRVYHPSTELTTKIDDDAKKRSLTLIEEEEQLMPKKSKQAKLDSLFGTEDVDLRTVIPAQIMAVQNQANTGIMTPPPPPVISDDQTKESLEMEENICNQKKPESPTKLHSFSKKSNLDDVRAKLAKAAKYNKIGKHDKSGKELSQRLNLVELNMNEETQEANDDKIRTIISQAQELLDSRSINQEQYKNLVQTVMSINETTKLKEAKRRESLVSIKSAEDMQDESSEITALDAERNAARDAVLKKRIPKLTRDQVISNDIKSIDSSVDINAAAAGSPNHEDKNTNENSVFKQKANKEKRNKHSKWGDRDTQQQQVSNSSTPTDGMVQHKSWLQGAPPAQFNKRGGFAGGRVPHPPMPPVANMRMPQVPMPSPWQIGAGVNHFPNPGPPMLRSTVPPPPQPPAVGLPAIPAPPAIPKPCNSIDNPQADMVRTITIDGRAKEIRIYDQIAIVFMELDQPREIGFQAGQRSIIIDNMEPFALHFNDEFKEITIDGDVHRVRFGFPSRELYIDDHWYEIYFGGPPVTIPLKNKFHTLKAEGPPPQVNIGALRRDLVLGKINMIVDAHIIIPVFLDAKVQSFRLSDKEHTIQFADNLLTVLLNGEITQVEYGGLPKSMTLGGTKYFIRFGALPQGIVPGKVLIKDMKYIKTEPPIVPIEPLPPVQSENMDVDLRNPKESIEHKKDEPPTVSATTIPASVLSNINIDDLFQKLVSSGILGATSTLPAITPAIETNSSVSKTKTAAATTSSSDKKPAIEEPRQEIINPINLSKPETIKTRQSAIVSTLFSGMQCSSCGVRFPPEQTIKYSQHLDWHFRQNRRERDSTRKAHSRKWYYELADWVQYEEIEDLEEREKNFFEAQQNDVETFDETSNQRSTNSPIPSCAAGPEDVDRVCDMCQEKFEQFYNEELEEWHLRSAVRVENKIYHPLCYEDYKASLLPPKEIEEPAKEEKEEINADDDNAMDIVIKIESDITEEPKTSTVNNANDYDDDDDDVIVLPNEEPSVTEIDDDDEDEYIPVNVTREEMGTTEEEGKDSAEAHDKELNDTAESDVEIQEPNIPFTDLDNYVEKELPEGDESSQLSFMNVKIKEEPKDDDDDEDDGFEDVGTVLIGPDEEISIQSSEGTQTHTIASSTSATSPSAADRPPSVASLNEPTVESEETTDATKSLDSTTILEQEDEHNLSAAGPAPVGNLVNKIKINITKNIMSTNSASTATATATTNNLNSNELSSVSSNNNTIATTTKTTQISTIPVLCGGGTSAATTATNSSSNIPAKNSSNSSSYAEKVGGSGSNVSAISVIGSNMNVSSISVIGSYGGNASRYHHHNSRGQSQQQPTTSTSTTSVAPPTTTTTAKVAEPSAIPPPAVEEVIDYELKPSLKKVTLKKTKKIECGIETSGLCSIM